MHMTGRHVHIMVNVLVMFTLQSRYYILRRKLIVFQICSALTTKVLEQSSWTQDVNWTNIRRFEKVHESFWKNYVRLVYVMRPGGWFPFFNWWIPLYKYLNLPKQCSYGICFSFFTTGFWAVKCPHWGCCVGTLFANFKQFIIAEYISALLVFYHVLP